MVFGLPAIGESVWGQKILDSINAVKAIADAALPAAQKNAPSGVAPLDGDSLVPQANLPAHLAEAELSATYVSARVVTGAGVDATGTTDSTTAIQAILTAAASGQRVFLPDGTYKHTGLSVPAGVTLESEGGADLRYIATTGSAPGVEINSGAALRRVTVSDVRSYGANPVTANGISFASAATDATVEECEVYGFKSAGIATFDGERIRIVGNHVHDIGDKASLAGDGILIYRGAGSVVSGNTVHDVGKHGIYATGDGFGRGSRATITGNVCYDNGDCGVITNKTDHATIGSNVCHNNGEALPSGAPTGGAGIQVTDSTDATVTGNACDSNTENGIVVQALAARVAVTGNTCHENQHEGIKVWDATDVSVTGNTVTSGAIDGIQVIDSERVAVGSNVVRNNGKNGIHAQDSTAVSITGNSVIGNNQVGPNDSGIQVDHATTVPSDITIVGNMVLTATGTAHLHSIRVYSGDHVAVVGNVARGASGAQVQIDSAGVNITNANNVTT